METLLQFAKEGRHASTERRTMQRVAAAWCVSLSFLHSLFSLVLTTCSQLALCLDPFVAFVTLERLLLSIVCDSWSCVTLDLCYSRSFATLNRLLLFIVCYSWLIVTLDRVLLLIVVDLDRLSLLIVCYSWSFVTLHRLFILTFVNLGCFNPFKTLRASCEGLRAAVSILGLNLPPTASHDANKKTELLHPPESYICT
jgi:hypothetical protein